VIQARDIESGYRGRIRLLVSMYNNSRMSGAMFLMLKKSADRRQHEALENAFKRADVNGDGYLSVEEYYRILKDHGIQCTKEEILQLIQMADKDNDGLISREEFLGEGGSADPAPKFGDDEKTDLAFKAFDKNQDGYITKTEMLKTSKNLTKRQVDAVFLRNDVNQDGKISREEFHEFMHQSRQQKQQQQQQK